MVRVLVQVPDTCTKFLSYHPLKHEGLPFSPTKSTCTYANTVRKIVVPVPGTVVSYVTILFAKEEKVRVNGRSIGKAATQTHFLNIHNTTNKKEKKKEEIHKTKTKKKTIFLVCAKRTK